MGNTHRSRQRVQKHCVEVSEFNYGNGILKIRIISWNIAENPEALHDSGYCQLFLNQDVIPDIYFIAFQERRSCRKEITKSIAVLLSSAHVHLRTDHRGSLTTCIFVKAEIYQTCSESAYFKYDLRQFTHRRTKSCLGITLTFGLGFKLTFINCHFQGLYKKSLTLKTAENSAGSKTLKSTLRRQRNMTNATKALLRRIRGSQVVFWCGDLNSRVKLRPREIKTFLNDKDIRLSAIAEHDELLNCINAGLLNLVYTYTNLFSAEK
ncbi:hypothetical protein ACOME3_000046 [Neoechinorhynchus agilis]